MADGQRKSIRQVVLKSASGVPAIGYTPYAIRSVLFPVGAVVRRFFGDDHVMYVTFAKSGNGLSNERGLLLEFWNRPASTISHAGLDTAYELVDMRSEQAL